MSLRMITPRSQPSGRGASIRRGPKARVEGRALQLGLKLRAIMAVLLGRWALLLVTSAGIAYGIFVGQSYVSTVVETPVAQINVNGDFTYVSKQQVIDVITPTIDEHFLQLDLARIKQDLEQQAWIDVASVGRRWPNQLDVTIIEQKPIARWSDKGFLNQRGELIESVVGKELLTLPLLDAQAHTQAEVMAQYQNLAALLRSRNLWVAGLVSDEKRAWTVTLNNGLAVNIGRDQVMDKMKRFLLVYDSQLQQRLTEIESVDVRYNNGVAVQWHNPMAESLITQNVGIL